jgi:hypothetical protein
MMMISDVTVTITVPPFLLAWDLKMEDTHPQPIYIPAKADLSSTPSNIHLYSTNHQLESKLTSHAQMDPNAGNTAGTTANPVTTGATAGNQDALDKVSSVPGEQVYQVTRSDMVWVRSDLARASMLA